MYPRPLLLFSGCALATTTPRGRTRSSPPSSPHRTFSSLISQIADAAPPHYARADPAAFRAWLAAAASSLDPDALLAQLAAFTDGATTRCALVPLVYLAHAFRWGATRPPQWVMDEGDAAPALPHPLGAALHALRAPLGLQASGSISLLFLWNWGLVGGGGGRAAGPRLPAPGEPFDPATHLATATVRPRFRFCSGELEGAEAAVLHSVLLTEAAGTGMGRALVRLFEAAADAEDAAREDGVALKTAAAAGAAGRAAAAAWRWLPWSPARRAVRAAAAAAAAAADLHASLKQCLGVFHTVFRQASIPISAWAFHIQPSLCAVAPGDHGVGGAQMPWVHASDAAFGIDQAGDALGAVVAANAGCLLPEERLFVSFCAAHGVPLRRWLRGKGARAAVVAQAPAADPFPGLAPLPDLAAPARDAFASALAALVAWRATHRARAAAYLAPPGAPVRATTGGTAVYGGGGDDGDDNAAAASVRVRAGFNALMDGRITSTRRAGLKSGGPGVGVVAMPATTAATASPAMAELFPE